MSAVHVFALTLWVNLMFYSMGFAVELPKLKAFVNDLAGMIPQASVDELEQRLFRFRTETGRSVTVLTVTSHEEEDIDAFGRKAFKSLPLNEQELKNSFLLIVFRKEQIVDIQLGSDLRPLFPQPQANHKLQAQLDLYFGGLRPDLGIHGAVHYVFKVIKGEFRVDGVTEEEKLEEQSKSGAGAGAVFALFLAPFLAFFVGGAWGIYATHRGIHTETRLFVGAVFGGGTAKLVATLMSAMGSYSDGLWYFILVISIPLAAFGSLTEYWMSGDWSGIPRDKDESLKRKPSDKMGI